MKNLLPLISLTDPDLERVRVARLADVATRQTDLEEALTGAEAVIYHGLSTQKRRLEFIAGRVLAKQCIVDAFAPENTTLRIEDIEILRDDEGRPTPSVRSLPSKRLTISISHGGDFAVAAISSNRMIGVDVEPVTHKPAEHQERIASREERNLIEQVVATAPDRRLAYCRLFSAKEAMVKCLGPHLFHALHHYRLVAVERDGLVLKDLSNPKEPMFFVKTVLHDNHVFSLLEIEPERLL